MTTIIAIHEIGADNTTQESDAPASDEQGNAPHVQLVVHNDDDTPQEFVIELLHSVFKTPVAEAVRLTQTIGFRGQASYGIYSRDIANRLLGAARERILISGHQLRITSGR
jgi:ATP-dependent Clp protease adapter protein ClpS